MDPLSKRLTLVRYGAAVLAMFAVVFGYRVATTGLRMGSLVALVSFAINSLKYPFFDYLVRMTRGRWPKLRVLPWLWIGYGATVSFDMVMVWLTVSDEGGASLALAMTILISPWFLAAALVLMTLHTLIARKR
jgi:hypothetical protein